ARMSRLLTPSPRPHPRNDSLPRLVPAGRNRTNGHALAPNRRFHCQRSWGRLGSLGGWDGVRPMVSDNDGNPETEQTNQKPVIVGIGASAGGIRALIALFEAIPDHTGAAFVVVVHLDPQSRSDLSGILAGHTRMPVTQVGAPERLQPNHVYVIPPDRQLRITDHEISAVEFDEPRGQRAPIDLFFRSLAGQHGDGFAV